MPTIVLGNTAPIEAIKPDESTDEVVRKQRPDLGNTTTTFVCPPDKKLGQILTLISSVFASHHSDEPAAWVESDDPQVAEAVALEFDCPVGRPDDWEEGLAQLRADADTAAPVEPVSYQDEPDEEPEA